MENSVEFIIVQFVNNAHITTVTCDDVHRKVNKSMETA